MDWITANWEWCLLGFMVLEKCIRLSPSDKDDVILDMLIKPIWNKISAGKK